MFVVNAGSERMSALALLLNLLWLLFGGLWMAVAWGIAAVVMAITIIGIPWARAAFNIAAFTLLPFGQKAVSRAQGRGHRCTWRAWEHFVGSIRWLVARTWSSHLCTHPCCHNNRLTVRLGAHEARPYRPLADRQNDCASC
jgi:uncharacterized membrane protein YccF (DUF307 family)